MLQGKHAVVIISAEVFSDGEVLRLNSDFDAQVSTRYETYPLLTSGLYGYIFGENAPPTSSPHYY